MFAEVKHAERIQQIGVAPPLENNVEQILGVEYIEEGDSAKYFYNAALRIQKIANVILGCLIVVATIGAGSIIAYKITLVSLLGVLAVTISIALVILGLKRKKVSRYENDLTDVFKKVLNYEAGRLTQDKIKFFQENGKYCRELTLTNRMFAPGIFVGQLFEQLRKLVRNEAIKEMLRITDDKHSSTLVSIWHPLLIKLVKQIDQYNRGGSKSDFENTAAAVTDFKNASSSPENGSLLTPSMAPVEQVKTLIKSCSQLQTLDLCYCAHEEVLKECLALPLKHLTIARDSGIQELPATLETFTSPVEISGVTIEALIFSRNLKKVHLKLSDVAPELREKLEHYFSRNNIPLDQEELDTLTRRRRAPRTVAPPPGSPVDPMDLPIR